MAGLRAGSRRSRHDLGGHQFSAQAVSVGSAAAVPDQFSVCVGRAGAVFHRAGLCLSSGHVLRRGHPRHDRVRVDRAAGALLANSRAAADPPVAGAAGPAAGHRSGDERREKLVLRGGYFRPAQRDREAQSAHHRQLLHEPPPDAAVAVLRGELLGRIDAAKGSGHGADVLRHHADALLRLLGQPVSHGARPRGRRGSRRHGL